MTKCGGAKESLSELRMGKPQRENWEMEYKPKIGLYLSATPSDGGVYQYSLSMLEAVTSLRSEGFRVVVAFSQSVWISKLKDFAEEAISVIPSTWTRGVGRLVRRKILPVEMMRRIAPFVHPTIRKLQSERCDLWIFPAQDPVSYFRQLDSLVAIHDLMHKIGRAHV